MTRITPCARTFHGFDPFAPLSADPAGRHRRYPVWPGDPGLPHRGQDVRAGGLAGRAAYHQPQMRARTGVAAARDPPRGQTGLAYEQATLEHSDPEQHLAR